MGKPFLYSDFFDISIDGEISASDSNVISHMEFITIRNELYSRGLSKSEEQSLIKLVKFKDLIIQRFLGLELTEEEQVLHVLNPLQEEIRKLKYKISNLSDDFNALEYKCEALEEVNEKLEAKISKLKEIDKEEDNFHSLPIKLPYQMTLHDIDKGEILQELFDKCSLKQLQKIKETL